MGVRVPALMRANRPRVGDNDECLGTQSTVTTAGEVKNDHSGRRGRKCGMPRGAANKQVSWELFACASRHNHGHRFASYSTGRWTAYNFCDFLILNCSMPQGVTKTVSANPHYEKPQRELLRWPGTRDRQMATPIDEDRLMKHC